MNGIIPAANVKILGKTLQALSKVGDELYIEIKRDTFSFITLNLSKTVCARFAFLDSFFSNYEVDENAFSEEVNDDKLTCKMHLKTLIPLFRGNLERKLDFFKIEYENNADFIIMKMKYRLDDIVMVHKLRLMDTEILSIGISTDSGRNNICASSSLYNQLLTMFCLADDELTFEVTKSKMIARNYCAGAPYRPKAIRCQVNLNAGEFAMYNIEEETIINFAIKPFRTVIHFAEGFNLNIGFNFDTGGKPLSMIMKNPTFNASFMVATLNPNNDMQSTMTTTSIPSRIITQRKINDRPNITIEDQEAMENENWDEFDFEINDKDKDQNESRMAVKNSNSDKDSKSTSSKNSSNKNMCSRNKTSRRQKSFERTTSNDFVGSKKSSSKTKTSSHDNSFSQLMEKAIDFADREIICDDNERLSPNNEITDEMINLNCSEKRNIEHFDDVIPASPESPRRKKARIIFGRCYDPTFHESMMPDFGLVSDSE